MTLPASFASFRHLAVRRKMSKSEVSGISKVAVVGDGAAGVRPRDPLTFAAVTVAVGGYIPARRATNIDPMVAVRYE